MTTQQSLDIKDQGFKSQAYNDVYLSSRYNEKKRKQPIPERVYLSGGYNKPTIKEFVPQDYDESLWL